VLLRIVTAPGVMVASVAVLAIMLLGAADIVATWLKFPIPGAHELIQVLMVLVIFLALPDVEARRQHIAVDMFYQRFSPAVRRVLDIVNNLLSLLFYGAMGWQGWKMFRESWSISEYAPGVIPFPIYPSKALFAFGVTFTCLVILVNLRRPRAKAQSIDEPI
jgi:TRAP-type C4-dicarboxylate transport system permease small subunit